MKVLREISKKEFKDFLANVDVKDKQLYDEVNTNNGFGIFQFSGSTAVKVVNDIHPENFDELTAINAIARPGTISFKDEYASNKSGDNKKYPKIIDNLLKGTRGIVLFQEQIMKIFHEAANFSLDSTNKVRSLMKALGKANRKKEDVEKWETQVAKFTEGALSNGLTEAQAKNVADDLLKLSSYSFNKCFSGNSVIDRDNWRCSPLTVKEMFLTKNNKEWADKNGHSSLREKYNRNGYGKCYSLNKDGRLRLNRIIDIYFQGVRRTFKITTESGKSITVTSNHKFPIENGEKTIDDGLSVGDLLFVNSGYEISKIDYSFSGAKIASRIFKLYEGEGFKRGSENSAFIDGSFSDFNRIREKLLNESNGKCELCKIESSRLECHHKDRNRKNNTEENLILLCPSCHKKEDYKYGRNKKCSKGLLTKQERIISIEEMPEEEVFDIEMEHPFHTLSVNKIIASNSHAVAYTLVGVQTLYLSRYFRKYFYSATLAYEATKKDAIKEAFDNCRKFGYKLLPPDVNNSLKHFSPAKDNGILFGLNEIKNIGDKPIESIISNRPYKSIIDFIIKNSGDRAITKKVVESLVMAGGFDDFINSERKLYVKIVKEFYETKKSVKVKELLEEKWRTIEERLTTESGVSLKTTNDDFIAFEKEMLGSNFFHNNFSEEEYAKIDLLYKKGYIDKSFSDVKEHKTIARVPIYVSKFRTHVDKNKNEMAFMEAEDMNGETASFPIFASYWKFIKEKFTGEGLYIFAFYRDQDNKIMFGSKKWLKDEEKTRLINSFRRRE